MVTASLKDRTVSSTTLVIAVIAALIIGYFSGREHVKYEIRSAFSGAGNIVTQGLQNAFGGGEHSGADSTVPTTPLGEKFTTNVLSLEVVSAEVRRPEVSGILHETRLAEDSSFVVTLAISNMHERKILRYNGGSMFDNYFRLRDDVDNTMRRVLSFGSTVVGALSRGDDVLPGDEATHIESFQVPPPKTKFLILSVDLGFLGATGNARFKIDASQISGFESQ